MRRAAALLVVLGLAAPAFAERRASHPSSRAKAVVRTARSYLAEENPKLKTPKDCSDFVRSVFGAHKLELPRTAHEMSVLGKRVRSSRDLRMGDLVFFSGEKAGRIVGHVGIYVNNGIFIHLARRKDGVRMESLYSDHYRKRYLSARRLL